MKYSDIALKVLVAKECGLIKTNAQFWTQFSEREKIEEIGLENDGFTKIISTVVQQFTDSSDEGFICAFDEEFPAINQKVKNSDKPYLCFTKAI